MTRAKEGQEHNLLLHFLLPLRRLQTCKGSPGIACIWGRVVVQRIERAVSRPGFESQSPGRIDLQNPERLCYHCFSRMGLVLMVSTAVSKTASRGSNPLAHALSGRPTVGSWAELLTQYPAGSIPASGAGTVAQLDKSTTLWSWRLRIRVPSVPLGGLHG